MLVITGHRGRADCCEGLVEPALLAAGLLGAGGRRAGERAAVVGAVGSW